MHNKHLFHLALEDEKQILCYFERKTDEFQAFLMPILLVHHAVWIYDLTAGEMLRNYTDKPVVPIIDADEVDRNWFIDNLYILPHEKHFPVIRF